MSAPTYEGTTPLVADRYILTFIAGEDLSVGLSFNKSTYNLRTWFNLYFVLYIRGPWFFQALSRSKHNKPSIICK